MQPQRNQQDSTRSDEISPPRQENGTGGLLFDIIYEAIAKRTDEKINSHVEEFANEMQALRNQMKKERALMEDFLKERFGLGDEDCAKFWDGLNRQVRICSSFYIRVGDADVHTNSSGIRTADRSGQTKNTGPI